MILQRQLPSQTIETESLSFLLTTPSDYDRKKTYPLIVFLHGAGERGNDLERLKIYCIPKLFSENPDTEKCITVSPLCPCEHTWIDYKKELISLIELVKSEYSIDEDNVSLCGISMGGFGTWELGMTLGKSVFHKIAPLCGGGMNWRAGYLQGVKIRVYHGAKDDLVPIEQSVLMVNALKAQNVDVDFTVFEECAHNCWDKAFEKTDLIRWLITK